MHISVRLVFRSSERTEDWAGPAYAFLQKVIQSAKM